MKEPCDGVRCPCGSGRPYVGCCLGRHIEKSRANPFPELHESLKKEMAGRDFASLDEANAFLKAFYERRNSAPSPDFLGLSPDQVRRLIQWPLTDPSDMLVFNRDLKPEDLSGIPIVSNAVRFLRDLAAAEPLKATAKGNLPPVFAKRLFDDLDDTPLKEIIKFRSEADSGTVHVLRLVLTMAGLIRKEKGSFRLTRKGRRAVEDGFSGENYLDLFLQFASKFNWGFQDGFSDFRIIQQSVLFSLYLLRKKARVYIGSHSLSPYFVRAFPMILAESNPLYGSAYSLIDRGYIVRFLERFCEYFGLIGLRVRSEDPLQRTFVFRTSPVFEKFLKWKI